MSKYPHLSLNPTGASNDRVYPVPERLYDHEQSPMPHITSMAQYRQMWLDSLDSPNAFWEKMAREMLDWYRPFTTVQQGDFERGNISWFSDGELNACYNCVDRWAAKDPERVAIIYEADEPGESVKITYGQLLDKVCRLANKLLECGIRKGDVVAIYKPMVPEALVAFLACARIGAPHTVVFAGFSAEALRDRINDAHCKVLLTADEGKRGGKIINLKKVVNKALEECPSVQKVIVYAHTKNAVEMVEGRDEYWDEALARHRPVCPYVPVNAEDILFLLYTSGSTGKPKGLVHTTAGYLLGAAMTHKFVFDWHEGDVFGCMADVGWVTGHSYIVYGPLCNGATTIVFESIPTYPNPGRYWDLVAAHRITQFYTAPTAIRAIKRLGDQWLEGKKLGSLRVLATVGEPINSEAWQWYYNQVGRSQCAVVDTYWQTETGSIIISPLPGAVPTKPGCATVPFFGIDPVILDPVSGQEQVGNGVSGLLALRRPWPSMARTIYGDHSRYLSTYFIKTENGRYYLTGDGAMCDADGYYWVLGRVDDVINVSGHRLSTGEIESALTQHPNIAEAAVVGANDDITGQRVIAFVTTKGDKLDEKEAKDTIRRVIGPFAVPKQVYIVQDLPKTRSGKIVRRVLRKLLNGEGDTLGDLSTMADLSVVDHLKQLLGQE